MKKAVLCALLPLGIGCSCVYAFAGSATAEKLTLEERVQLLEKKVAQNAELERKVAALTQENVVLKLKLDNLEKNVGQVKTPAEPPAALPAAEKPKTILDTVKLKGRFAAGFFKSANGNQDYATQPPYSHGSFEVPETKVQLSVAPDPNNTVLLRANLNNAAWNSLDVFCVDSKIGTLIPGYEELPFTVDSRLGRLKIPFGEEMFTNDIVDSATTDNSIGNPAGYDEGFQLSGNVGKGNPLKYWVAVTNGNGTYTSGATTRDNYFPKALTARLGYQLLKPLYVSGSVYTSGGLGRVSESPSCDMTFGGTTSSATAGTMNYIPTGATGWKRNLWEVDGRYDIGKGKNTTADLQGAYCDSTAYIRGAFGQLYDVTDGAGSVDRNANYGYVEGLWNFHPKLYGAFRYSIVDMMDDNSAALNYLNYVKQYDRYSLGVGYRWSGNTILRVAYEFNTATLDAAKTPITDANDDVLMITLGAIF